jgi:hypothetical protein
LISQLDQHAIDCILDLSTITVIYTLWTSARKAITFKENGPDTSYSCENRRFCYLLHNINNCAYNLKEMTVRQNMIQEVLVDPIMKHRNINTEEILTNKEIDFGRFRNDLETHT